MRLLASSFSILVLLSGAVGCSPTRKSMLPVVDAGVLARGEGSTALEVEDTRDEESQKILARGKGILGDTVTYVSVQEQAAWLRESVARALERAGIKVASRGHRTNVHMYLEEYSQGYSRHNRRGKRSWIERWKLL